MLVDLAVRAKLNGLWLRLRASCNVGLQRRSIPEQIAHEDVMMERWMKWRLRRFPGSRQRDALARHTGLTELMYGRRTDADAG